MASTGSSTPGQRHCPDLQIEQILGWADTYYGHHGRWPQRQSGPIEAAPGETWLSSPTE